MPIFYEIEPRLELVYLAGTGLCTGAEYVAVSRAATQDPRRNPGQKVLLDVRDVVALSIGPEDMAQIVEMDRALAAEGVYTDVQTALLTRGPGSVETLIGRLYNVRVQEEALGVALFHDLGRALAWLNLAEAQDEIEALRLRLTQAA